MAGTGGDDGGLREGEANSRTESGKSRMIPSVVSLAMGRTASKPAGVSSINTKELVRGLYKGVLLDDDKVKFWIDENLHQHSFMVLARALSITWGGTEKYWRWTRCQEDCFGGPVDIEEARLIEVSWLEILGSFPSMMLSPMVTYEVVFKLMMTEDANGWHVPVDVGLTLPDGTTQSRTENLEMMPKGRWLEIHLGVFGTTPENIGDIQFFLTQTHIYGSDWKRGLVLKGVIFRPKH